MLEQPSFENQLSDIISGLRDLTWPVAESRSDINVLKQQIEYVQSTMATNSSENLEQPLAGTAVQ